MKYVCVALAAMAISACAPSTTGPSDVGAFGALGPNDSKQLTGTAAYSITEMSSCVPGQPPSTGTPVTYQAPATLVISAGRSDAPAGKEPPLSFKLLSPAGGTGAPGTPELLKLSSASSAEEPFAEYWQLTYTGDELNAELIDPHPVNVAGVPAPKDPLAVSANALIRTKQVDPCKEGSESFKNWATPLAEGATIRGLASPTSVDLTIHGFTADKTRELTVRFTSP